MWAEVEGERKKVAWYVTSLFRPLSPHILFFDPIPSTTSMMGRRYIIVQSALCLPRPANLSLSLVNYSNTLAGLSTSTMSPYNRLTLAIQRHEQPYLTLADDIIVVHVFEDTALPNATIETVCLSRCENLDDR
jgi:hypothetical protein